MHRRVRSGATRPGRESTGNPASGIAVDDATGRILCAVQETIGPQVPLTASCDLHANVTPRMVDAVQAIVGYKTFPHVDLDQAGHDAMAILLGIATGQARPRTVLCRLPMILPGENGRTTDGPLSEVVREVIALEKTPGVLSASAFSVQPWLDIPEVGCCVLVITDGDEAAGRAHAERIADPDLPSLPWKRIGRPIYPLDDLPTWRTPPIGGVHVGP